MCDVILILFSGLHELDSDVDVGNTIGYPSVSLSRSVVTVSTNTTVKTEEHSESDSLPPSPVKLDCKSGIATDKTASKQLLLAGSSSAYALDELDGDVGALLSLRLSRPTAAATGAASANQKHAEALETTRRKVTHDSLYS